MARLDEKVPWPKRLRRGLRTALVLAFFRALGLLPHAWACAVARFLGRLLYRSARRMRAQMVKHLGQAFPELGEADRERIARQSLEHLVQCGVEVAQERHIDRRLRELVEFPAEDRARVDAALAQGRGVIAITGHIGNWELMARRATLDGVPLNVVAAPMNTPALTAAADAYRRRGRVRTLWRGQGGVVRDMLEILRDNQIIALLIDQDIAAAKSIFVPFFGKLAATPRGAGDLAARTGAPMLVAYAHRLPGNRHRIHVRDVVVARTGNPEIDGPALTAAATLGLEQAIREAPAEWVWMHKRWKTRPPEEKAAEALAPAARAAS